MINELLQMLADSIEAHEHLKDIARRENDLVTALCHCHTAAALRDVQSYVHKQIAGNHEYKKIGMH